MDKPKPCHTCKGRCWFDWGGKSEPCPTCNGKGVVESDYGQHVVNKVPMFKEGANVSGR